MEWFSIIPALIGLFGSFASQKGSSGTGTVFPQGNEYFNAAFKYFYESSGLSELFGEDNNMSQVLEKFMNNENLDYPYFQKLFDLRDVFSSALAFESQQQMMDYQLGMQKDLMAYQQELNSPARMASMMRSAGLNPDILGVSQHAGLGTATGPGASSPIQFQMPNSAQLRSASAETQMANSRSLESVANFASQLAGVFLKSQEVQSTVGLQGAQAGFIGQQTTNQEEYFKSIQLENDNMRQMLAARNFDIIKSVTDYIDKNYLALGGSSFKDFDGLGFGPVITPILKSQWESMSKSDSKQLEEIIVDKEFQIQSVAARYATVSSNAQMRAYLADLRFKEKMSNFLSDFYTNLDPQLNSAVLNLQNQKRYDYLDEYDPLLDAGLLNQSNVLNQYKNKREYKELQMIDPVLMGAYQNKMIQFENSILDYVKENEAIKQELMMENLKNYQITYDRKYLSNYYEISTGVRSGQNIDVWLDRMAKVGDFLSPAAQATAMMLLGRGKIKPNGASGRYMRNRDIALDFDNMTIGDPYML